MGSFEITERGLFADGKKSKIISGAMHYFRIFPEYWEDRLLKLKELGCNCVETYIAWHLHELTEGDFITSGRLDFVKYIGLAQKLGLYVILRPGPFICSECDFGGLPWWLLKYDGIELRTYNKIFLEKTRTYLKRVCDLIRPHLITNGGNVILIQLENEFGGYGNDKAYLNELKNYYIENGIDVPFVTSDGAVKSMLEAGSLSGVFATANYRWDSVRAAEVLKEFQPDGPCAFMELWNGQAIHCGSRMVLRDLKEVEYSVRTALEIAELVNLYMFHGGTNFGFMNGSEYCGAAFKELATSYDVQAPLNEYGGKTQKYYAEQKIICGYLGKEIINKTAEPVLTDYGEAKLTNVMPLSGIDKEFTSTRRSDRLLSMEQCGQGYGYIEYISSFETGDSGCLIKMPAVRDRALIYVDGAYIAEVFRGAEGNIDMPIDCGRHILRIFVENSGRIKYGNNLFDRKGLLGEAVIFDKQTQNYTTLSDWTITSYPFNSVRVDGFCREARKNGQNLFRFEIDIKPEGDTYLEVKGFYRGFVMFNGFNLGRHNEEGPQRSLYVPAPLLKNGKNEIIVFDFKSDDKEKRAILHGRQLLDGYAE